MSRRPRSFHVRVTALAPRRTAPSVSPVSLVGLLGVALALLILLPGLARAAQAVRIGRAPRVPAGAQPLGAVPASTSVSATVALAPRDPSGLAAYAQQVSSPGSPLYHQFLSVAQFAARFGATTAQVAQVRSSLAAQGLTVGPLSPNHLSFDVSAPAATVAGAFATPLERYRLRDGTSGFINGAAPAVSAGVAGLVQGVVGLDTLAARVPMDLQAATPRPHAASPAGRAVSGPGAGAAAACTAAQQDGGYGGYTAPDIASAYGLSALYGQGDLGAGTTIALYELEPYSSTDISQYQSCYGTSATVTNVLVDGGAGSGSGSGEAALDIEDVIGLAPAASIRVYEGPNSGNGPYDTYAKIVTDDAAQVISTSWGVCEAELAGTNEAASEATLFEEAAAQGQSVFAAAGDDGADDCGTGSTAAVDDPASQPDVTGVGGTSLSSDTAGAAEAVWNDGTGGGAGGGGVSTLWPQPSYQSAVALPAPGADCGASACREVPDVSADADPDTGYAIFYRRAWREFGGTSAAAPTWAAVAALADALPACAPQDGRIGLANAALYAAAGTGYAADFKDITSGNNSYDGVTGFAAAPGYDMASGLGSPITGALAPAMCGDLVTVTQPGPQSATVATAQSLQLTATSSAGTAVTWRASNLPPGLSLDLATGEISGTPTVTGSWTVTVTATDASGSAGDAQFSWTVAASAPSASSSGQTATTAGATTTGTQTTTTPTATTPASPVTTAAPVATTTATTPTAAGASAPVPVVTLQRPGTDGRIAGHAGQAVRLQVQAHDSAALALRYGAKGLPPGLQIDAASGLISGTPRAPGTTTVTLTASDARGSSATVSFVWSVGAPARVTTALRFSRAGRPTLSVSILAGRRPQAIGQIRVAPAAHVRFATGAAALARGVTVRTLAGRRLQARVRLTGGALVITLAARQLAATVRVAPPALTATRAAAPTLTVQLTG